MIVQEPLCIYNLSLITCFNALIILSATLTCVSVTLGVISYSLIFKIAIY